MLVFWGVRDGMGFQKNLLEVYDLLLLLSLLLCCFSSARVQEPPAAHIPGITIRCVFPELGGFDGFLRGHDINGTTWP